MYVWIDRILHHYVLLQSDLREPTSKGGGLLFADLICPWKAASSTGWRQALSHTNIAPGCAVASIVSTTILQGQTLPLELEMSISNESLIHTLGGAILL